VTVWGIGIAVNAPHVNTVRPLCSLSAGRHDSIYGVPVALNSQLYEKIDMFTVEGAGGVLSALGASVREYLPIPDPTTPSSETSRR